MTLTRFAHHRLDAYRVALELFAGVEAFAATLPRGHADLKDQVRRAAAATGRHLAEGANRRLPREKAARFVLARAECGECAAILEMALALGLRPQAGLLRLADRVAAMCTGLIRREERLAASDPPDHDHCRRAVRVRVGVRVRVVGPRSPSAPPRSAPRRLGGGSSLRSLRPQSGIRSGRPATL